MNCARVSGHSCFWGTAILSPTEKKRLAAAAALRYVEADTIVGIGTGSTVNEFIKLLDERKIRLKGAVSSSRQTSEAMRAAGIREFDLNETGTLAVYVDGADEATPAGALIKGGGGALTREKIIAAASERFICIIDDGKLVETLGRFPLPVEVIPMARAYAARRLLELGGQPVWREAMVTDNGNVILDVHHLKIDDPRGMEDAIRGIAGVVSVGLFAHRGADVLLVAGDGGVRTLVPPR